MNGLNPSPVLEARQLRKLFPVKTGLFSASHRHQQHHMAAVDGVDMVIRRGEVVGIAGGSGAGKTSLAMTMLRLYEPTEGQVLFEGNDITDLHGKALKPFRRQAQIIFQDPYGSLNPRFTVERTVVEPLIVHGIGNKQERATRVKEVLELVGLAPAETFLHRFPHQLSGGQRQRLCIARAMVLDARFLVADEPVSMLDVSIRAGIITLLNTLVRDYDLSVLYVSHDIAGMRYVCHNINIMYRGRIVERGPSERVVNHPLHPYSQALISAVPEMEVNAQRQRVAIKGESLASTELPSGCRFRMQCPFAMAVCAEAEPELKEVEPGHFVACYLY